MTDAEMRELCQDFPDLYFDSDTNTIRGELSFRAYYDGKRLHRNPEHQEKFPEFLGCYDVLIELDHKDRFGFPILREVGGRIQAAARRRNVEMLDMHVNGDGTCCLSIFLPVEAQKFTPVRFVKELVFGYFAWHAYWEAFDRKPPWGEYSHYYGLQEKMREIRAVGRNDPCPCGSGKKYKYCCLTQAENRQRGNM